MWDNSYTSDRYSLFISCSDLQVRDTICRAQSLSQSVTTTLSVNELSGTINASDFYINSSLQSITIPGKAQLQCVQCTCIFLQGTFGTKYTLQVNELSGTINASDCINGSALPRHIVPPVTNYTELHKLYQEVTFLYSVRATGLPSPYSRMVFLFSMFVFSSFYCFFFILSLRISGKKSVVPIDNRPTWL